MSNADIDSKCYQQKFKHSHYSLSTKNWYGICYGIRVVRPELNLSLIYDELFSSFNDRPVNAVVDAGWSKII
jgi:hypothetical protein